MYEFSQTISHQDSQHYLGLMRRRLHGPAFIRFAIFGLLIPYGAAALIASFGRLYFLFSMPGQDLTFNGALVIALLSIGAYWAFRDAGEYLWQKFILPRPNRSMSRKILINDDGVQTTSQTGVRFTNWVGVLEIETSKHGVFMRIGVYGWLFLPNRLFADDAEKLAVVEFAQSSMRAARK